jgi:hypothetical protein
MSHAVEVLNGEYVVLPKYRSPAAFIADVEHVHRSGKRTLRIPVAHLLAFKHPSADMTYPHWKIRLFVRPDVRYEVDTGVTTTVFKPPWRAGLIKAMLYRIKAFIEEGPPPVHPDLSRSIGASLIKASICSEPAVVHVHSSDERTYVELGTVFHDDEDA